jgi:hypothetical protein
LERLDFILKVRGCQPPSCRVRLPADPGRHPPGNPPTGLKALSLVKRRLKLVHQRLEQFSGLLDSAWITAIFELVPILVKIFMLSYDKTPLENVLLAE